jgi:hypothetical protein
VKFFELNSLTPTPGWQYIPAGQGMGRRSLKETPL